mgnify:CR=1 FL=1
MDIELQQKFKRLSKELPLRPRERIAIEYRWGLTDGNTHTLEETGRLLSVTRERIRQMEAKVFEIMRQYEKEEAKINQPT